MREGRGVRLAVDLCNEPGGLAIAAPGSPADTAGSHCNVWSVCLRPGRGSAERALTLIADALAGIGHAAADIADIVVTVGPGSFTGQRVSIAMVQGLALASGATVHATTALGALALAVSDQAAQQGAAEREIAIASDARRGDVYLQTFDPAARPTGDAMCVSEDAAVDALAGFRGIVSGPAAERVIQAGGGRPMAFAVVDPPPCDPRALLHAPDIGASRPVSRARALYLKPPDAKPAPPPLARVSSHVAARDASHG